MGTLSIIKLPDPILREKSLPVEMIDAEVRAFASDMLETMYAAPGIGLAAPQVGVLRRIIVVDTVRDEETPKSPIILINPEILSVGDELRLHEEGCLSIPEMYAEVERPALVRVRYVNIEGEQREEEFQDLLATVVQHEIDHLNGVLFIDHISRLKRDLLVKKFLKAQREKAGAL
jgi:peptide deformylase